MGNTHLCEERVKKLREIKRKGRIKRQIQKYLKEGMFLNK
jgi:hypothetical protein